MFPVSHLLRPSSRLGSQNQHPLVSVNNAHTPQELADRVKVMTKHLLNLHHLETPPVSKDQPEAIAQFNNMYRGLADDFNDLAIIVGSPHYVGEDKLKEKLLTKFFNYHLNKITPIETTHIKSSDKLPQNEEAANSYLIRHLIMAFSLQELSPESNAIAQHLKSLKQATSMSFPNRASLPFMKIASETSCFRDDVRTRAYRFSDNFSKEDPDGYWEYCNRSSQEMISRYRPKRMKPGNSVKFIPKQFLEYGYTYYPDSKAVLNQVPKLINWRRVSNNVAVFLST
ncbi:MAG TPA: hypothetical protein V6C96_04595 [Vampirovibrionales bacterium]